MIAYRSYCLDMLQKEFGYTRKVSCEAAVSVLYTTAYSLPKCNVNLYDIHQLLYHIQARKYRNIQDVLQNIRFFKRIDYITTMHILMEFMNSTYNTKIKAVTIGVIYQYIHFILDNIFDNTKKNITFLEVIALKAEEFVDNITKIKGFPKYLKKQLIDIILNATSEINTRLHPIQQ